MIPGIGTLINSFAVIGVGILTRFFVKKEIKRILSPGGLFIFDIANAKVYRPSNTTKKYCRHLTPEIVENIIAESGFEICGKEISYCLYPLKFAHPKLAKFSVKTIFPLTDKFFRLKK